MLFDKICRRNGITHRLTAPRSPTTTGKIERFHQTLRRELLDDARPFTSLLEAQAALDDWVRDYNAERPHQALEPRAPVTPAERFQPGPAEQRELLPLWLPGAAGRRPRRRQRDADRRARDRRRRRTRRSVAGGPVEFDRVVPPSGNLGAMGRQFWLGPQRAGQTVRFWASVDVIHLTIGGARVKSLRSHLSIADLAQLARRGRGPAGPAAAAAGRRTARRSRSTARSTTAASSRLAGKQVLAAEILGGRPVIVRIEPHTLMFLDPRDARAAPRPPQPAHPRAGAAPAGRAPGRPAAAARGPSRSPFSAASAPPA